MLFTKIPDNCIRDHERGEREGGGVGEYPLYKLYTGMTGAKVYGF